MVPRHFVNHNSGCPVADAPVAPNHWVEHRLALAETSGKSGDGQFDPLSLLSLKAIAAPATKFEHNKKKI
jgi:hypothetical protein